MTAAHTTREMAVNTTADATAIEDVTMLAATTAAVTTGGTAANTTAEARTTAQNVSLTDRRLLTSNVIDESAHMFIVHALESGLCAIVLRLRPLLLLAIRPHVTWLVRPTPGWKSACGQ